MPSFDLYTGTAMTINSLLKSKFSHLALRFASKPGHYNSSFSEQVCEFQNIEEDYCPYLKKLQDIRILALLNTNETE